ncbi:MAG: dihydropteroate synthase [Burkholderiales bacterium]|nr:dihydropteroate synthase [Burkholderiales bacterium]
MLICGKFRFPRTRPLIMGIVNVTPDSFSDGGRFSSERDAIDHGMRLVEAGADILDIGGESSRPGAQPVSAEEECSRVLPVLNAFVRENVPASVDTTKVGVMREAIRAGASMVNDINALQGIDADFIANSGVGVCLMHKQGEPMSMQLAPSYDDVVREVYDFLAQRVDAAVGAGISRERIVIDPGFGFGKTLDQNLELLRHLDRFQQLGLPILAGLSRKSMLGEITGKGVHERLHASIAASLMALERGASIVRVHDVGPMRDALTVFNRIEGK